MKTIAYSKDAIKTLRRMPTNVSTLIVSKIEQFATDATALGNNLIALRGRSGEFRLRVGDWRVVMTETGEVIAVIKIGPRGSVYED
jgi:mRNA interferase RelE/StbE